MQNRSSASNLIFVNAQLNEAIKAIVRMSRKLYLDSLNAMLVVRRSGDMAQGFVAVTSQLRMLSKQMDHSMGRLQRDVEATLYAATHLQIQRHVAALARAAIRESKLGGSEKWPNQFRSRVEAKLLQEDTRLGQAREYMKRRLREALDVCLTGTNLVVVANIEANQAGSMASTLKLVTAEVENTVTEMTDTLHSLLRDFTEVGRLAA